MKKYGGSVLILLFLITLLSISLFSLNSVGVYAQSDDDSSSESKSIDEKALECIDDKLDDEDGDDSKSEICEGLSIDEQAFLTLASGDCRSQFNDNSVDEDKECWPSSKSSSSCSVRETALAVLALNGNKKSEEWLLDHNDTPSELIWYLQIESDEETNCEIMYNDRDYDVDIGNDKKFDGDAGSCLKRARDNYWLLINDNCVDEDFEISCDKDFISNLLYSKSGDKKFYLSSNTESASADGSVSLRADSYCFAVKGKCDYEGSLWAAAVLDKEDYDIDMFLPYLVTFADDLENERLGSYAFLNLLTGYNEFYSSLIDYQKDPGYFDFNSNYKKNYDTALAMLSLESSSASEFSTAKDWLSEIQDDNGCWGSLRDTAFLLYAGWPSTSGSSSGSGSGSGGSDFIYCSDEGNYCITKSECQAVDGSVFSSQYCSGLSVCCSKDKEELSCNSLSGDLCEETERCKGNTVSSSDGSCCLGTCEIKLTEPIGGTGDDCEDYGYSCRSFCFDEEVEKSQSCSLDYQVCCGSESSSGSSGGSSLWIWILLILIIVVIVLIVFRKKVKALFSKKGDFKEGGVNRTRPSHPPAPGAFGRRSLGMRPMRPRPLARPRSPPPGSSGSSSQARGKSPGPRDKELDATLKKLKEMSG